jgi:hypothetical protein
MPNISASDYTTYLKFKAAAATPIRPAIQTRDNVTLSQSVINANVLASQAAFVTTPTLEVIGGVARVQAVQPMRTNNPNALSAISHSSGSVFAQPGGLPAKNRVGTYTRLPQIV